MGQIIKELPNDLSGCKDVAADVEKIEAWGAIFSEPVKLIPTLAENLIHNWGKVAGDVSKVDTDYKSAKYENVGEDVADILIESVGPIGEVLMSLY